MRVPVRPGAPREPYRHAYEPGALAFGDGPALAFGDGPALAFGRFCADRAGWPALTGQAWLRAGALWAGHRRATWEPG
jgi:hypothetical protein